MKLMVFDVGGTAIKYSVMDDGLAREKSGEVPTPQDTQQHFFEVLHDIYRPHAHEVVGIAMSLPGFIDSEAGRCNGGGWMKYNRGKSIAPELSALCGCPVRIANDGKCAALAEVKHGSLKGCQNAGVFIIGSGVGGGLVINGEIVQGKHFTAGEFSFVGIGTGSLMTQRCSTTALLMDYRKRKEIPEDGHVDGKLLFERLHSGEPEARAAVENLSHEIAGEVVNLTVLLDLERVAIGGGISRQPVLVESVRNALDELYARESGPGSFGFQKAEVVPCAFGSEANQVGAYLFYRNGALR